MWVCFVCRNLQGRDVTREDSGYEENQQNKHDSLLYSFPLKYSPPKEWFIFLLIRWLNEIKTW